MSSQMVSQINSPEIAQIVEALKTGRMVGSAISYFDGKVYDGHVLAEGVNPRNLLVDVDKFHQRKLLAASGKKDEAAGIDPFSDRFKGMLEDYRKVLILMEKTALPYYHLDRTLLAAAGPTVPTAYETVRRVNYLTEVSGPKYRMDKYNAIKGVEVKPTANLNFLGYIRSALLAAQSEIGDHVVPDLVANAYTSFEKQLFADAWRYEFSMRERQDSVVALEAQVAQDMMGAFAKLKDDKIVAGANAAADTTPTADIDALLATYETHYTDDASEIIEDADSALDNFGGASFVYWPRPVARAYRRNVNATNEVNKNSIGVPESNVAKREWALPLNEHILGIVNDGILAASAVVCARGWASLYQGPVVQVAYKNPLTAGQVEGRIHFDFNGFKAENTSMASHLLALLS